MQGIILSVVLALTGSADEAQTTDTAFNADSVVEQQAKGGRNVKIENKGGRNVKISNKGGRNVKIENKGGRNVKI